MSDIVIYEDGTVVLNTTVENKNIWNQLLEINFLFNNFEFKFYF